jgi:hypothetical protein
LEHPGAGNHVAVVDIVPVPGESFEQTVPSASPGVLRETIRAFAERDPPRAAPMCSSASGEENAS